MSLYRNIFKKAWEISWKRKYLWFFGIFAALLGGSGGSEVMLRSSSGNTGVSFVEGLSMYKETGIFSGEAIKNIFLLFRTDSIAMISLIFLSLLVLAFILFFIWLATVSQVAIVDKSANVFAGKKDKDLIKDGVAIGNKNFWPVLFLNIITKLIIVLVLVIASQMLILADVISSFWLTAVLSILLFVVLFLFTIFFSLIMRYAIAFVVIKKKKFCDAIKSGWQLFTDNWLVSIEMAFSLFFITLLGGLAITLAILILVIPFAFLGIIFLKLFAVTGFLFIFFLAFLVLLALIVLGGSIITIFAISSWTGLFVELINKGGISKIVRLTEKISK